MPRRPVGQPLTLSTTVTVRSGGLDVLTDPGAITLQLQKPDLTVTTYTIASSPPIVRDGQGLFHIDLPGTLTAGPYQYAWVTTGTAAGVREGRFDLAALFTPSHVSYEDVLERLELTTATLSASKQAELQDMIASAVSEQEQRVGAVAPRMVTETVVAAGGRLMLPTRPVLSITSALSGVTSTSVTAWSVPSAMAGLVESATYLSGTYTVTYVAGRNPVPQALVEAGLLRVQHSYETQRGSADTAFTDQTEGGGSAFLLILRARDKEAPYVLPSVD